MTGCAQNSENDFPKTTVRTESRKYEKISTDSRGTRYYGEGDINLDAGSRGSWSIYSHSTDNGYGWQDDIVNQDGQRFQSEGHSSNEVP